MTLFEQIKKDQLAARKERNAITASLLTTLIGEISAIAKNDNNRDVTDADVVKVAKKFIDGAAETMGHLDKGGLAESDAYACAAKEKELLTAYMPKQMTEAELTEVLCELVTESGPNLGKLMALLKEYYPGRYDGKMASLIAKTVL